MVSEHNIQNKTRSTSTSAIGTDLSKWKYSPHTLMHLSLQWKGKYIITCSDQGTL